MAGLLSLGAGAGEGLLEYLKQKLVEEKSGQEQQQITETGRHNLATEGNQSRSLDQNDALRRDALAEKTTNDQASHDQALNVGIRQGQEAAPIGIRQSSDEVNRAVSAGLPKSNWGPWSPPDLSGQDSVAGPIAPNPNEGMPWLGTQAGIQKVAEDKQKAEAAANKPAKQGRVIEQPDGMYEEQPDGSLKKMVNPDGSAVKKFHAAPPPVVIQGENGPLLGDRGTGNTKPFKSPDGQGNVGPKPSAQISDREDRASKIIPHFDDAEKLLKQAEEQGALGPIAGRTFGDFLAGKVGSTGDSAKDELLGELRTDMSMLRSGTASLHGRSGANMAVAHDLMQKMDEGHMSYAELSGALKQLRSWVTGYAGNKTGTGAASGGDDIFQQYLNRTKQ